MSNLSYKILELKGWFLGFTSILNTSLQFVNWLLIMYILFGFTISTAVPLKSFK